MLIKNKSNTNPNNWKEKLRDIAGYLHLFFLHSSFLRFQNFKSKCSKMRKQNFNPFRFFMKLNWIRVSIEYIFFILPYWKYFMIWNWHIRQLITQLTLILNVTMNVFFFWIRKSFSTDEKWKWLEISFWTSTNRRWVIQFHLHLIEKNDKFPNEFMFLFNNVIWWALSITKKRHFFAIFFSPLVFDPLFIPFSSSEALINFLFILNEYRLKIAENRRLMLLVKSP
jgi:hypothetical protein